MSSLNLGETVTHPLVGFIDEHSSYLLNASDGLEATAYPSPEAYGYIKEKLSPIARAVIEVSNFTLEADDLLNIWKSAVGVFPERPFRYQFAAIITGAYAIQGFSKPSWKTLPQTMLHTYQLPEEVKTERKELELVDQQVESVMKEVKFISSNYSDVLSHEVYENFGNGLGPLRSRLFRALSTDS